MNLFRGVFFIVLFGLCTIMYCNGQSNLSKELKINEIQVLGTHNSYARPVDPKVLSYAKPILDKQVEKYIAALGKEERMKFREYHPNNISFAEGLNYDHPPLNVQLDSGLRSLEFDVYYDPTGGRYLNPASYRMLRGKGVQGLNYMEKADLDKPGFKLLHMADLDFRTYHTTLKGALLELRSWSEQNPEHSPLFIMIESKESGLPIFPDPTEVLPFNKEAFKLLDNEILEVLGRDRIICPDDVRGNFSTLREAVLAKNWPNLEKSRGKFLFMLLPSTAGLGNLGGLYVDGAPNLENKVMFVQSSPDLTYGAFLLLDNAKVRLDEIKKFVKAGYLVRTRADIETYEAKVTDYSRADAAFESGAQVISTDFFRLPNTYGTSYQVKFPHGERDYRVNPVNATTK